jgi:hypothetical protein
MPSASSNPAPSVIALHNKKYDELRLLINSRNPIITVETTAKKIASKGCCKSCQPNWVSRFSPGLSRRVLQSGKVRRSMGPINLSKRWQTSP